MFFSFSEVKEQAYLLHFLIEKKNWFPIKKLIEINEFLSVEIFIKLGCLRYVPYQYRMMHRIYNSRVVGIYLISGSIKSPLNIFQLSFAVNYVNLQHDQSHFLKINPVIEANSFFRTVFLFGL